MENDNTYTHQYQRYFNINMRYQKGANNYLTGINRAALTVIIAVRFSVTAPVIIRWLYNISQPQALNHLNKLVDDKLLTMVHTHRSPDGRVYIPTYTGAKYAQEQTSIDTYFRSKSNPALQVNHNHIMHDLMNTFIALRGLHNHTSDGVYRPLWTGFLSEPEFKRLYNQSNARIVDGIAVLPDRTVVAIEIENSFKNKSTRQTILLKYLASLKAGHYQQVFIFSQSTQIFDDIKRLHTQLLTELPERINKRTQQPFMTHKDAALLQSAIVYRTKFCDEITALFYS
ncbi:hypothetical protein PTRA_b0174 [Pseudoalteromonas translucida KMM 520]|uniref:Uncharacterized protein n=1 Tax=Pseudoalteromonas translucida KMM 520 TaxID=1315283 RepID=A0A0U2X235_9GAMM|nr:hypothetical protein [Pseudoalteromonas translucida]ALS34696.1 hypothetical protein PTRA_b0174 [Pseudoalteromonas translucida KMM 520]